jgi:hypothetical protein
MWVTCFSRVIFQCILLKTCGKINIPQKTEGRSNGTGEHRLRANPKGDAPHLYPVDFTPFGTQEEARLRGFEADTAALCCEAGT